MKRQYLYSLFFIPILAECGQDIIQEVIRSEQGLLDRVVYLEITENSHRKVKEVDFHDNGNKFRSKTFDKAGEVKMVTEWYRSGQKKLEHSFKKGKKNGPWTTWYENGNKESEKTYVSGLIHGLVHHWNEKGELRYQGNFIADALRNVSVKNGRITEWYENGQKKSEQHYRNGQLDGFSKRWYRNGQRLETGKFYDGSGISYTWDEKGHKIRERIFEKGLLIEE